MKTFVDYVTTESKIDINQYFDDYDKKMLKSVLLIIELLKPITSKKANEFVGISVNDDIYRQSLYFNNILYNRIDNICARTGYYDDSPEINELINVCIKEVKQDIKKYIKLI